MILDIAGNVITVVFFLFILSYYALFLIRHRHPKQEKEYRSVTIIIPAHNEEEYIRRSVQSALDAEFAGEKEIIVVDDASRDATPDILESFRKKGVIVLRNRQHSGKSTSLNRALGRAKGDAIAIIDGDSIIERPALQMLVDEVGREKTAAACGAVRVQNRNKFVCMWLHIEVIYNSLIRALFSRINANVVTPGALSVYRKDALDEIGGFSTDGFAEDVDVAIRLHRKGYRINLVENALSDTNMPYDAKGFLRQRFRLARGMVKLLKKHMQLNTTIIDLYTLPLFFFTYVQAVVMGILTVYQVTSGYLQYFVSQGVYVSWGVGKFFLEWFSILGFVRWSYRVFAGIEPFSIINIIGVASTLLTYPLYILAMLKYDRKIDLRHIIPIAFMAPYWLLIMVVYIMSVPEILKKEQFNIWKKNE